MLPVTIPRAAGLPECRIQSLNRNVPVRRLAEPNRIDATDHPGFFEIPLPMAAAALPGPVVTTARTARNRTSRTLIPVLYMPSPPRPLARAGLAQARARRSAIV